MKDICQRYSSKVQKNINALIFLYGGNQLNLELTFDEQVTSIDRSKNEMNILVYKNEIDNLICPKCGTNIEIMNYLMI